VGDAVAATLRFLGSGVAGKSVTARLNSVVVGLGSSCGVVVVAEALLLRFLGAADGFWILVYLATASSFSLSVGTGTGVMVLATRAERLRDMLKCFEWLRRVLRIAPDVILSVSRVRTEVQDILYFKMSAVSFRYVFHGFASCWRELTRDAKRGDAELMREHLTPC
jgi:hypothetical protein